MDIDVDGAPNAYGPPGKKTLDYLSNARYRARPKGEIVGYLTDDDHPTVPIIQGPHDPYPGYYVSTTHYVDRARPDPKDPLRYVDATKINYVVLGDEARRRGARVGDFVAVYSRRHRRAVFGIVGDSGNPSGAEGSLHLLQELGYPFESGKTGSVERKDIVIRFFPQSNPGQLFFRTQAELDKAADKMGLSRNFSE
jgi:Fungal chitosanase of glycosyl hydrolase group 75